MPRLTAYQAYRPAGLNPEKVFQPGTIVCHKWQLQVLGIQVVTLFPMLRQIQARGFFFRAQPQPDYPIDHK